MSNIIKQISSKAKHLYKSGKYKKWTDAIKAASKLVKGSAKSSGRSIAAKRKKTESKKISGSKKTHTDRKSHNVKIKISGVNSQLLKALQDDIKILKRQEGELMDMQIMRSKFKNDPFSKSYATPERIKHKRRQIADTKKRISKLKKAI